MKPLADCLVCKKLNGTEETRDDGVHAGWCSAVSGLISAYRQIILIADDPSITFGQSMYRIRQIAVAALWSAEELRDE